MLPTTVAVIFGDEIVRGLGVPLYGFDVYNAVALPLWSVVTSVGLIFPTEAESESWAPSNNSPSAERVVNHIRGFSPGSIDTTPPVLICILDTLLCTVMDRVVESLVFDISAVILNLPGEAVGLIVRVAESLPLLSVDPCIGVIVALSLGTLKDRVLPAAELPFSVTDIVS